MGLLTVSRRGRRSKEKRRNHGTKGDGECDGEGGEEGEEEVSG